MSSRFVICQGASSGVTEQVTRSVASSAPCAAWMRIRQLVVSLPRQHTVRQLAMTTNRSLDPYRGFAFGTPSDSPGGLRLFRPLTTARPPAPAEQQRGGRAVLRRVRLLHAVDSYFQIYKGQTGRNVGISVLQGSIFSVIADLSAWGITLSRARISSAKCGPILDMDLCPGLPDTLGNVLFKAFLCFTNVTILFQDVTMFLAAHYGQIQWSAQFQNSDVLLWKGLAVFQGWSLGIELSFYFIAPYLLNLPSRWLIFGAICSLVAKAIAIGAFHLGDPWTYRFFPFELGSFLLGALAFRYRSAVDHLLPKRMERYCAYSLAIAIAAIRVPVPLAHVMYPLALACVLPYLFRMTSGREADQLIGELSYPFYIFHVFALRLARSVYYHHWIPWSYDSVAWMGLGMTLVLSAIGLVSEMRFIEPWRIRFAEPKRRPAMTAEVPTSTLTLHTGLRPVVLSRSQSTSLRSRYLRK
jgi:hypothetical protein